MLVQHFLDYLDQIRNFRVKYQELSIEFENLAYLQSIENKCKTCKLSKCSTEISEDPMYLDNQLPRSDARHLNS